MKNNQTKPLVLIEYKNNKEAQDKFTRFIVDYYLEKILTRKVDSYGHVPRTDR